MRINHQPRPAVGDPLEPADVERALAEWFGREVVLLGSGRAGIHLWMRAKALDRHEHTVLVPPFMSSCVLDTLGRCAFPVLDGAAQMALFYHQFGLLQTARPPGMVLEDICHGFFIPPSNDAVFSLPKFFGIRGMAGGIVTQSEETAGRIREMRDAAGAPPKEWESIRRGIDDSLPLREAAYALLIYNPQVNPADLAGFPIDGIADNQKRRRKVVQCLNATTGSRIRGEPFAFPYFGDDLEEKALELSEVGIDAGIYRVDINRDMMNPDYRRCLLLPCHQDVTDNHLEIMGRILNRDKYVQRSKGNP